MVWHNINLRLQNSVTNYTIRSDIFLCKSRLLTPTTNLFKNKFLTKNYLFNLQFNFNDNWFFDESKALSNCL